MKRRVVVTGIGIVTCLGSGYDANWESLRNGRSGVGPISLFDATGFQTRIAGEVHGDIDPDGFVPVKELRRMDRFQHFALVAAGQALKSSGLTIPVEDPYRFGAIIGSGMGGLHTVEYSSYRLKEKGPKSCHPLLIPKAVINLAPAMISIRYAAKGPNFGLVNACTSGASAIGEAYRIIREGRADIMFSGGSEAVITPLSVDAFSALRALSARNEDPQTASRPFDLTRDGFIISEGAGVLILEEFERAKNRNAVIYGEIIGYGATGDAFHFVMPDPNAEGACHCMKFALEDAELNPTEIDYINAHGTSTELNDKMETIAIKKVFGADAYNIPVSSTKSMTGHLIGAAGAVESIFCLMALEKGIIPPTINLNTPDPECDLDYVPNVAREKKINTAMSNSFAFGGQNATLVFRRV